MRRGPEELGPAGEIAEPRRQHADHGDGESVVEEGASDDIGIGVEPAPPEFVGEDGDLVGLVGELVIGEGSALGEGHAEGGEKFGRDACGLHPVWRGAVADDEAGALEIGYRGECGQGVAAFEIVGDGGGGTRGPRSGVGVVEDDKAFGLWEWQGPDEDGIDDGVDGEVCPETQRDRRYGGGGEARCLGEGSEGTAEVEHRDGSGRLPIVCRALQDRRAGRSCGSRVRG